MDAVRAMRASHEVRSSRRSEEIGAAEGVWQARDPPLADSPSPGRAPGGRCPAEGVTQRRGRAAERATQRSGRRSGGPTRPRHPPPAESPPATTVRATAPARNGHGEAGDRKNGAPDRIRTCDARVRSAALYPLSYGGGVRPAYCAAIGQSDAEPVTPMSARPPRSPEISPSSHRPGSAGVAWRTSIPFAPTVAAHTRRDSST